jgi:hypothetical protein
MNVLLRFIALGFVTVGILQFAWSTYSWYEALQTTRWPTTTGTISFAKVVEVSGGGGTGYVPTVTYTYEVRGVSYLGKKIHVLDGSDMPSRAQQTIREFGTNSTVQVFFDPDDPSNALLKPGLYLDLFLWLALSLFAIGIGGSMLYVFKAKGRSLRAA